MRTIRTIGTLVFICLAASVGAVLGQTATTFNGTALIYGSGMNTRTVTRTFTMRVNRQTTAAEVAEYLKKLEGGGQDGLRDAIRNNDLGHFSLGSSLGQRLNAVVVDTVEGKTRVRAVFERWIGFGELREGYRSVDYPFSYVEIIIDPRTGKGDGTFIPAAQIRFKEGKAGAAGTVEIEDFGTFPGRLLGVRMSGFKIS